MNTIVNCLAEQTTDQNPTSESNTIERYSAAIYYSRGTHRYDNKPTQRFNKDFSAFASAVLDDRGSIKGQQYICAALGSGLHDHPEKHPGLNHWRLKSLVKLRRYLPVDYDGFKSKKAFEDWKVLLKNYSCVFYTTASHTEKAPRARGIFELSREVSREESLRLGAAFEELQRELLGDDFAKFDKSVYQHEQPCFLPLVGAEGGIHVGESLNVDVLLVKNPCRSVERLDLEFGWPVAADHLTLSLTGRTPLEEAPTNVEKVLSALHSIDPDGDYREVWFPVLCALKSLRWSCSESLAREYSARGKKYDANQFATQWNAIQENKGVGVGTLFRIAKLGGWLPVQLELPNVPTNASSDAPPRFTLKTASQLKALRPIRHRIKGILPERGLASIYGTSGSGKTFLVLDVGIRISLGGRWFGHLVRPCPVVYVALEGAHGISSRLQAWEKHHKISIPGSFRVTTDHLSLFNNGDIVAFSQQVLSNGVSGGVIFIDTLNQSAPEADENTSKDMGKIISHAQQLQKLTDSLVVLVHHSGKDQSKGLRGHSSLHAALDAAIEVRNDSNGRAWTLTKSKDSLDGGPIPFLLDVVKLGQDSDGDVITSCVALPDINGGRKQHAPEPRGANQKIALKAIRGALTAAPIPPGGERAQMSLGDAIDAAAAAIPCEDKRKRERAQSAINGLVAANILSQQNGEVWLP